MSDFKAKSHQLRYRLGTPLEELTALPMPLWPQAIEGSERKVGDVGEPSKDSEGGNGNGKELRGGDSP